MGVNERLDAVIIYFMAYADLVAEPQLTVYADADHTESRTAFALGENLYPVASAATRGELSVPVDSVVPADTKVVSYTEGAEGKEAYYLTAGEGQTAFTVAYAEAEIESAAVVTVCAIPPTPAWILPPGYELKDGKIYKGSEQIDDPSAIEAKLTLQAGEFVQYLLVDAESGEGSAASYKKIDADVTAEITSDTAAHFSAAVKNGTLTVEVSAKSEEGETASMACRAEGYEFRNKAEVTVVSTRKITVYVPCISYPLISDISPSPSMPAIKQLIRIAAVGAGDQALQGAALAEEDTSKITVKELDTQDHTYWPLEAEVPKNAETVLLLYDLQIADDGQTDDWIAPYFAFKLAEEDSYVMSGYEFFPSLDNYWHFYTDDDLPWNSRFGTYADAALTQWSSDFEIGDQLYFRSEMTNEGGDITVSVSDLLSDDTGVIDENLKAVGDGAVIFTGSWYGVEGYVFPGCNNRGSVCVGSKNL